MAEVKDNKETKNVVKTVVDIASVVLVTIPVAAGMIAVDKILKKNK